MPIEIIVPRLGWSMEEGAFVAWLKKEGEYVRAGEPLFNIEGDKAIEEIESLDSGYLRIAPGSPKPGDPIKVGTLLGYLVTENETAPALSATSNKPAAETSAAASPPNVTAVAAPQPDPRTRGGANSEAARPSSKPGEPSGLAPDAPRISPRALRAALELGVDWTKLRGSGRSGRIRERDVRSAASLGASDGPSASARPLTATTGKPSKPFSLEGKVTIVTGAASGIGAAIAEAFTEAGAIVCLADLNEAGAAQQALRLAGRAGQAFARRLDVTSQASCQTLVEEMLGTYGRCDVLVNNAGIGHVGTILTTSPEDLARLWAVNVQGMYFLARALLPSMIERRRGSIINLASTLGHIAMEDRFAYTVTKHAVVGLTRSLALDFGTTGVRINCICPGRVETPFVQARLAEYPDPEKFRAQMVATHAQKRMAQPWEIAAAAVYLASDESAFVTGSSFVIDGGYLCGK